MVTKELFCCAMVAIFFLSASCKDRTTGSAALSNDGNGRAIDRSKLIYDAMMTSEVRGERGPDYGLPGPATMGEMKKLLGRLECSRSLIQSGEMIYNCFLGSDVSSDKSIYEGLNVKEIPNDTNDVLPGTWGWVKTVGDLSCRLGVSNDGIRTYRCEMANVGSTGNDKTESQSDEPVLLQNSKAIYLALKKVEEKENFDRIPVPGRRLLPTELSIMKQVGRLTCLRMRRSEDVYKCTLGKDTAQDKLIYESIEVDAISSKLPGAAEWTKQVGGLRCVLTWNVAPKGIYICSVAD